jgi:hypothetical protein
MSIRSAAWIAWSLCLLCVALATASQILALLNGRTLGEIFITFAILTVSFSATMASSLTFSSSTDPVPSNPKLLKGALNAFVVDELRVDGPGDLTEETTAQTGFYTHQGLDHQASSIRPGFVTPAHPRIVSLLRGSRPST